MGTLIVLFILIILTLLALRYLKSRRQKGGCCGDCAGCSRSCMAIEYKKTKAAAVSAKQDGRCEHK